MTNHQKINHVRILPRLLLAISLVGGFFCNASAAVAIYTFTPLSLQGATSGSATSINSQGQVVGSIFDLSYPRTYAALWNGSTPTDIGAFGSLNGSQSNALGINNAGVLVGSADYRAVIWNGSTPTILGPGSANSVNSSGQVVGTSGPPGSMHATLWDGSSATDLGTLGGSSSGANSINDKGQIVGSSTPTGDPIAFLGFGGVGFSTSFATLWDGTSITNLGTLGGGISWASNINNAGQIVGTSYLAGNAIKHATLWNGAVATDLGSLSGVDSYAYDINDTGQIVGTDQGRATLWDGTVGTDLNSLLDESFRNDGWYLYSANAINDSGVIVGSARNGLTGQIQPYMLSPNLIPEPKTYLLFLTGLLMLAIARNRTVLKVW